MPRLLYTGEDIASALRDGLPQLEMLRDSAADLAVYLVGGTVRDLFLGRRSQDLDLVVEGPVTELSDRLGGEIKSHERFSTATALLEGRVIDLASARRETYKHPGALPSVEPAAIEEDLHRRDFTINAMAIPLFGELRLIDPHGGLGDLEAGLLRVLHPGSFVDDPTRAMRAARYAARLGFTLDRETLHLARSVDLDSISADRRDAEIRMIAREPGAIGALRLLDEWGVLRTSSSTLEIAEQLEDTLARSPWNRVSNPERALPRLLEGGPKDAIRLSCTEPATPWDAVEAACGVSPEDLAIARSMGAGWLDRYVSEWRSVTLEITGSDLIEAGVPEGPAVGRALRRALRAKLNEGVAGRNREMAVALEGGNEEIRGQ